MFCTKDSNLARFQKKIDKYSCADLVKSQLVWDRHVNHHRLQDMYNRLVSGGYGFEWIKEEITVEQVEPGALVCFKCQNNRIKTIRVQQRSADEGQTVYAFCTKCKNQWTCNN